MTGRHLPRPARLATSLAASLAASLATSLSAALLTALLPAASQAQTVHKCTVDGKVTYTELPCQAGTAAVIAVPETAAPQAAAAADLQRMRNEANALERARHQREASDDRVAQHSARAAQVRSKQCAKLRLEKKWADDDVRGAVVQNLERAKIKAQRTADRLALECPG